MAVDHRHHHRRDPRPTASDVLAPPHSTTNLELLTSSHRLVAGKQRAKRKRDQVAEVLFDDEARREFLTGFRKRKLQKKETAKLKRDRRERQERLDLRKEHRRQLAERAAENAAEVEQAYGATLGEESGEEWSGPGSDEKGKRARAEVEDEYEDEEQLATVTVVEEFDPSTLIYGPDADGHDQERHVDGDADPSDRPRPQLPEKNTTRPKSVGKAKTEKKGRVRYESKAARRAERTKQKARRAEKAERAGSKRKKARTAR